MRSYDIARLNITVSGLTWEALIGGLEENGDGSWTFTLPPERSATLRMASTDGSVIRAKIAGDGASITIGNPDSSPTFTSDGTPWQDLTNGNTHVAFGPSKDIIENFFDVYADPPALDGAFFYMNDNQGLGWTDSSAYLLNVGNETWEPIASFSKRILNLEQYNDISLAVVEGEVSPQVEVIVSDSFFDVYTTLDLPFSATAAAFVYFVDDLVGSGDLTSPPFPVVALQDGSDTIIAAVSPTDPPQTLGVLLDVTVTSFRLFIDTPESGRAMFTTPDKKLMYADVSPTGISAPVPVVDLSDDTSVVSLRFDSGMGFGSFNGGDAELFVSGRIHYDDDSDEQYFIAVRTADEPANTPAELFTPQHVWYPYGFADPTAEPSASTAFVVTTGTQPYLDAVPTTTYRYHFATGSFAGGGSPTIASMDTIAAGPVGPDQYAATCYSDAGESHAFVVIGDRWNSGPDFPVTVNLSDGTTTPLTGAALFNENYYSHIPSVAVDTDPVVVKVGVNFGKLGASITVPVNGDPPITDLYLPGAHSYSLGFAFDDRIGMFRQSGFDGSYIPYFAEQTIIDAITGGPWLPISMPTPTSIAYSLDFAQNSSATGIYVGTDYGVVPYFSQGVVSLWVDDMATTPITVFTPGTTSYSIRNARLFKDGDGNLHLMVLGTRSDPSLGEVNQSYVISLEQIPQVPLTPDTADEAADPNNGTPTFTINISQCPNVPQIPDPQ